MHLRGAGYYGKLPAAGDFKKCLPMDGPDGRTLDWLNDGWARHALAGHRPDLQQPLHFVWHPPGSGVATVGVALASRDRAGRRFPLAVFGVASDLRSTGDLLAQAAVLQDRAIGVAEAGRSGLDPKVLQDHVATLLHAWDQGGAAEQERWETATTAATWAGGETELQARMRGLEYAFSSGGRPTFVLRGSWPGDVHHLAAGVKWLERRAGAMVGMLFWSIEEGLVRWRATFEYALGSQFEALVWASSVSGQAFDTDPGAVSIPATFAPKLPAAILGGSLADLLGSRPS